MGGFESLRFEQSLGLPFLDEKGTKIIAEIIAFGGADGSHQVPKVILRHCYARENFARSAATIVPAFVKEQEHAKILINVLD
jgi:hypothetical protein